jgi:hypothetical protein
MRNILTAQSYFIYNTHYIFIYLFFFKSHSLFISTFILSLIYEDNVNDIYSPFHPLKTATKPGEDPHPLHSILIVSP